MNSDAANPKLIEGQEVRSRQGATLEVVRIRLTDYARGALAVQVHSIPPAAPADVAPEALLKVRERAVG